MEIIPIIYILSGQVVALYKGNIGQKDTYYKSPIKYALGFQKAGAKKLYIADLNAKFNKDDSQFSEIQKIVESVTVPIMLESNFDSIEKIRYALELGYAQVVLRSPTVEFAKAAISEFGPEKIVVQIFSKRSELIEQREMKRADDYTDVVDYAESLVPTGVKYIIYKDQRSEGTLIHPNFDEIDRLYLTVGDHLKIYSSGGISEASHIRLLKKTGAFGVIIGKAFYENRLTFKESMEAAQG